MMGEMKFRRVPRVLMNQFFSPDDAVSSKAAVPATAATVQPKVAPTSLPAPTTNANQAIEAPASERPAAQERNSESKMPVSTKPAAPTPSDSPIVTDCLKIIARETGLDPNELTDSASFVELGVDSLMSLVLSEKFKMELNLDVKSSVFIECPNIGELKGWLDQ
jgi:asperthecin polyketide synthase